ncbi:hypothetical protein BOX15_Mlig012039g1 [Macrostomum lignano]|uniref:AAA+ ATPase domain-containing protein n=1 Tax=Macrostomum lignano TaxID=282301 RepID=A0A267GLR3_9PLAT|nr:hypothetical protein BOX15_Mlig012039g1 [Macrostomum lignano]
MADKAEVAPPLVSKEQPKDAQTQPAAKPAAAKSQPTAVKKPPLTSNEQARQQAIKLKELKETRRSQLDARHGFMFEKMAEALGVEQSQVEEWILVDKKFGYFDRFFDADGSKSMTFYYQEQSGKPDIANPTGAKKLIIGEGQDVPLLGLAFVFTRTTSKAITQNNYANEINYTTMDASEGRLLEAMESYIGSILYPALKHLEDWGSLTKESENRAKIEEFLDAIQRFLDILSSAKTNMKGQMQLSQPPDELAHKVQSPVDLQAAVHSSEMMEKLEKLLLQWAKEIEQVLNESEQIRREADDVGPSAELLYWKSRMTRFNNLLEQMNRKEVRTVVALLHNAKSRTLKVWRQLDCRITDAANEARDNVKYLYTLDKFFGPLSKCNPVTMQEHIPALINAIRMIYTISQYYNTSERMTTLFVKVTNQMITTCKAYIREGATKIWDHPREVLVERMQHCLALNRHYQATFRKVQEHLRQNPQEKQFEFSENYIFGKFDTFCRRLHKIMDMLQVVQSLSGLQDIKTEGIEQLIVRYRTISESIRKKTYDILDHRKTDFDNDYEEFKQNISLLETALYAYIDNMFKRPMSAVQQLGILVRFERIEGIQFDWSEKYTRILQSYAKELENVRRLYQRYKDDPPVARNLPPISGKIAWSRHLLHKIEKPMMIFKHKKKEILQLPEARKIVRNYNKMAEVLLAFELLYHQKWLNTVQQFHIGLNSSLLVRNSHTGRLLVNLDPVVVELISEAHFMKRLGLEVPDQIVRIMSAEPQIKDIYRALEEMIAEFEGISDTIPTPIQTLMKPFRDHINEVLEPGLTQLSWISTQVRDYIESARNEVADFKILVKQLSDMIECRVEAVLEEMSLTALVDLPEEEPVTPEEFVSMTEAVCNDAAEFLYKQSQLVESSVNEAVETILERLPETKKIARDDTWDCTDESARIKRQRCQECQHCLIFAFLSYYTNRNTDALIRCTRLSLDTIRRRAHHSAALRYLGQGEEKKPALFKSDVVLQLPNITTQPTLEEIQHKFNKAVKIMLKMSVDIPQWKHQILTQKQLQRKLQEDSAKAEGKDVDRMTDEEIEELKLPGGSVIKPLNKIIADHKDVAKLMSQMSSLISSNKIDEKETFKEFYKFKQLWMEEINVKVKEFMNRKPILSEISAVFKANVDMEMELSALPQSYQVGAIIYSTEKLKDALIEECKAWRLAYGKELNERCAKDMDDILEWFDGVKKQLARPVQDLDDVRAHMAALTDVRENEIRIDMEIGPIEETYALLAKYDILFNDGNAERVDSLSYERSNLKEQARGVQDHLLAIQPEFKEDLLQGVTKFQQDLTVFVDEYDFKGPQEPNIPPREASDRVALFQGRFDDLWRKFETYSGGEQLFGLSVTDYPDLQRIKKDLNLMQKLYGLYNQVLETVNGYYDIAWTDIDIEAINQQLTEFQNRCRKLPKALKEWQAFEDLRKTIDDFSESCPLLELMSNKAMMARHWERLENLTKHKFDVESDNFLLRNLMEAPLLENKDDIEDICISATKEKDIEAKLKQVMSDWSAQSLYFSTFKSRGELLLKGDSISETVALMEDSLMVLGSLLSNRYNAPFKPKIQEWVSKLSGSTEIIENWLQVQNLWIYLEAVFVGGDIAKQLPAEAKRFSNIDKSWQRIMQRAHEIPNVVQCCMGDETLSQLLPHLLEQLELCQKSLTGYLEKKRLVFPRFFFVSDPALLEILGQASDSHTIQSHLLSIFDNTKSVTFDEKVYDKILSISSQEGETVQLETPVLAQGNVESWLGDLLRVSRASVHKVIRESFLTLQDPNFNLMEFEGSYPAQVGLLGLQMLWTRDAEEALVQAKLDKKIMPQTNEHFLNILNELINVTTKELTKMERTKFETLITIHVHQKDIFDDLVKSHVKSPGDFEWLKQSRFYFKEDTDQCLVSITDVDFNYMNEFLGCTDRLVITPLTDRCYITIAQALGMALGGAPAGPAGTGKTETTKDMGRCLGKYVVVFNCSDQMDYRGLGRIYKGLAQSGSWGCFDEFNRIELPVLSVAAQQIAIVLACKKERKSQFIFTDGDLVDMDPEFGIFLTMNPGYAGRQELPENLKINFRTVAMMVPDRGIIMRVKLASCGFLQNVLLAKKFFTLYKLCEEQLSKQVHYDFGLRNILSVLRTLGAFKRANPQDSEPMIVMRVLRDMNLSKLVDEDEPLFMSLIDDLFPGMQLDKKGYPEIEAAILHQVNEHGLIHHAPWVLKCIQLFETQRVRHGIMTLGPSGAGKTKCIATLMRAMTECGEPHKEMRMNPKAITAPQMFGRLDVATNDWTDGIFSTLWRRTHKTKKGDHVWLILDGPVDAIWIENLNSVLDDNKTLTLANGDRIPMAPNCKILFEVHNIDNASPATVSRNGMIFMSSSVLDWEPILKGWLLTRPESQRETIFSTFEACYAEAATYVKQSLNPKMPFLDCNYVRQATNLLDGLLASTEEVRDLPNSHLQKLIVFAIMWSLGALLELDDRKRLQENLKNYSSIPLPPIKGEDTIFEYLVNENGEWQHWDERVQEYAYPADETPEYTGILVPNVDNTRTDFLINTISKQGKPVLLIGEQGTAKTVIVKGYCGKYDPEAHMFKSLNFSSATTPNMFQRTIESYVDKRMGSTFGPPAGKKMTVFIDDINMPIINEWGDQITNEITRQMMEMNGFYNLEKPGEFTSIVDIQIIAAMIHPGGGRNDIPQRLKRQFCVFNCTLPSNASIDKIFRAVGLGHYCAERGFSDEVRALVDKLVPATRRLWQRTKIRMLPTPAKFHYVFNLRDLSRIWQGMLNTVSEVANDRSVLMSLWKHECTRTIADRFTEQGDKDWFEKTIKLTAEEECSPEIAELMQAEPYFVDFLREAPEPTGDEPDDADLSAPKIYEPIDSYEQLNDKLQSYMSQYNEIVRGGKLDLVFFKDAMIHLVKISRIIRTTKGHALLVGVGGSGKQSLTRLASFIAGYDTFQITLTRSYNVSNLLEDLKVLYRTAGGKGKGMTFVFTDNEIKEEGFLEFLNNMLSSGEIANLFARDEMDEILGELVPVMKKEFPRRPPSNENLQDYYMTRVLKYLHVVLCFSPVGEKFRNRSLKFPGLISGCTMDWFQRWPKDALVSVSRYFLSAFDIVCTPQVKEAVVNVMGQFQDLVAETCTDYFQRFRRQTHVTPKSYLSFISGYKEIYGTKKSELDQLAKRMNTGLKKLLEATESVNELSKELVEKEKELAVANKKAEEVLKDVTVKATAAQKVKAQVQVVKDRAQALVDAIGADKAVAEGKLEAAKPALEEAESALQTIKPADISTVKKLAKPPHLIMRIMDCVLLLFRKKIDTVTMDPERPCLKPSWAEALKLMSGDFLGALLNFPKDTINAETVEFLMPYFEMEDYNIETAKKVSGNVAGLCSWTTAMATFFGINKEVLPLKANLVVQEGRLEKAMAELNQAQALLDEKQRELDVVQALYDKAMAEKQALMDDAEACRRKMSNATTLIEGLSGERIRWTEASKGFEAQIQRLVGDVLLATAFLSYSGPFNQDFRNLLQRNWKKELVQNKIPYTEDLNLISMLVDNATISEWNLQGLPNDELSTQNGLIVTRAARFPLLIDPQGQGKAWIKNKEKNNELQLTSLNHKYFRTHLEDSLSLGRPMIIEDVGEELDPALDNILERNFIKSGTRLKVKVGDKECDVMDGFRLYITTKLPNPKYTPEIYAKTSMIDFTVTMKGLEDQLLGVVIVTEKAELETERVKLMEDVTANKRKMQELEDNLLYRLTSTEGSLVEDESLIEVLRVTKITAEDVREKLAVAADTEIKINTAREEYRPIATRGSLLYFLIVEMSMVNVMYQTSLRQFLGLFDLSMARSTKSPITLKRIANIIDYLTFEVFRYTARGLYEVDKFTFTILLTLKLEMQSGHVKHDEFSIFIKGGAALDLNAVEPKPKKWIQDLIWLNLVELSKLAHFNLLTEQITKNDKPWKTWCDEDAPEECVIPDGYDKASTFHKLLLVRSITPDRTIPMAKRYVAEIMGAQYADGVITNLETMAEEADCRTPMICFLSMGSDPTENIERLAKKQGIQSGAISMGQGQEVHARRLLQASMSEGRWILLQNCHLGLNFMDELLDTVTTAESHENFRCWITTEPHRSFPINMLQSSIKFTYDPPQGIRAGLRRTYGLLTQDQLDVSNMPQWKPILYSVAFMHTVVQERRKFGPIGWNIPYEFNQSDFSATVQFVQNHLDDMDIKRGVSWVTVRYMIGEVQYGGRVTDDYDKRLLNTYARVWFSESMFMESFQFNKGYKIPKCKQIDEYRAFVDALPLVDAPDVFGLHANADVTYQTNNANSMLETILNIQPKDSGAGGAGETRESIVYRQCDDMLAKLPEDYNPFEVRDKLRKMDHLKPLHIFLKQEIDRMQRVISNVRSTLTDLKLAIDGTIIMSENLQDALDNMFDARIPNLWRKISWESATLGFWFTDLLDRNAQFHTWLFDGRPSTYWMTGFFNPQGFLTAMRQEITRAHKGWALDSVFLMNDVTKLAKEEVHNPPAEGVYVYGLFLDGAGWDRRNARLTEPPAKVLYTSLPVVHIYAINTERPKSSNLYECPVYKKPKRTDLNYIFPLLLRTSKDPDHWILRGVALLCDTK